MQGKRNNLATKIRAALPVHCLAHHLNLCLQDAGRNPLLLRDALDAVKQIARLIKNSPKRAHLLAEKLAQSEVSGVTLKPLCPTRWTVRTVAIGAVLTDYTVLMETSQEVNQTTHKSMDYKLLVS